MINSVVVLVLLYLIQLQLLKSWELTASDNTLLYDFLLNTSSHQQQLNSEGLQNNNYYELTVGLVYGETFMQKSQLTIHKDDANIIITIIKFCVDIQAEFDMCIKIRNTIQSNHNIHLDTQENYRTMQSIYNLQAHQSFILTDQEERQLTSLNAQMQTDLSTCHSNWLRTTNDSGNIIINNNDNHNVSFHMYVVTHDDASERALYSTLYNSDNNTLNSSSAVVFNNLSIVRVRSTVFFEYILYKDFLPLTYHHHSNNNQQVVSWGQLDYVGVTSYKTMRQYYSLCRHEIDRLLTLTTQNNQQYDVIPLIRSKQSLLIRAVFYHGTKFKQVWDAVLFSLGYNETIVRRHDHIRPFYRNSYLIRPEWLKKLTVFMNTAIDTVLLNSTLYDIVAQPVIYGRKRNAEVAKRIFNSDTYQYFPFVFERLPSFYLTVSGANICHGDATDCPYNSRE